MNFFIRQKATMPYLTLEMTQDGLNTYRKHYDRLQNAVVKFSMESEDGCMKPVVCQPMEVIDLNCQNGCLNNCFPQYVLVYKWRTRDTRRKGRFLAKIEIDFLDDCGVLIAPIREDLYINIT